MFQIGQQLLWALLGWSSLLAGLFILSANFFQPVTFKLFALEITVSEGAVFGYPALLIATLIAAAVWALQKRHQLIHQHHQLRSQHQQEKLSVQAETATAETQALKQKVETLERALEKALSGKAG